MMASKKHQILACILCVISTPVLALTDVMSYRMDGGSSSPDGSDTINGQIGGVSNQINQDVGDVPGIQAGVLFYYHLRFS